MQGCNFSGQRRFRHHPLLAADRAIAAAETLLAARLDDKRAADLVKRSLEEIPSKLN